MRTVRQLLEAKSPELFAIAPEAPVIADQQHELDQLQRYISG